MEATSTPIESTAQVATPQGIYSSAIVAIVGPDGTGKSTTIDELCRQLTAGGSHVSENIRHWRPAVLPALGRLTPKGGAPSRFGGPPRRSAGRFPILRLAYYGLDFIIGHMVQDNPERRRGSVILYDRCALDMHVDPLRFGLKTNRGTGLLWSAVRKPDAVVLLYDEPGRILARKAELPHDELERQFDVWRELLGDQQVSAVVRINSTPYQVARRIASYLRGNRIPHDPVAEGTNSRQRMLEVVCRILAGASATGPASQAVAPARTAATEYAAVPNLTSPRILVPLGTRQSGARSLSTYSAHKPLARAFKYVLQKGLSAGVAQPLLRQRVSILESNFTAATVPANQSLRRYLAHALGRAEVFLGVWLGTPSPHQKPLFQVMDSDGRALGYAKIGWSQETIRIVKNEARALQRMAEIKFTGAGIPRALLSEDWTGYYVLLQSGPPSDHWSPSRDITTCHVQFLLELNQTNATTAPLQASVWWRKMQDRVRSLDAIGAAYDADLIEWALETCVIRFGETETCFGIKHGDFTPWNLLEKDQKLFVLDWEYAEDPSPAGSDLFHFAVQRATLVEEVQPKFIAREILGSTAFNRTVRDYFAAMGIEAHLTECYLALYAADTLSWNLWRDQGRIDRKSMHTRDAWRYLLHQFIHRPSK